MLEDDELDVIVDRRADFPAHAERGGLEAMRAGGGGGIHRTCLGKRADGRKRRERRPRTRHQCDGAPRGRYSAFVTEVKVVVSLVPVVLTAAMIATEIPAAMRPYSMAVAPDSSRRKRMMFRI